MAGIAAAASWLAQPHSSYAAGGELLDISDLEVSRMGGGGGGGGWHMPAGQGLAACLHGLHDGLDALRAAAALCPQGRGGSRP